MDQVILFPNKLGYYSPEKLQTHISTAIIKAETSRKEKKENKIGPGYYDVKIEKPNRITTLYNKSTKKEKDQIFESKRDIIELENQLYESKIEKNKTAEVKKALPIRQIYDEPKVKIRIK